jgi:hypothetical protein
MAAPVLNAQQRRFIVMALAKFNSPSEVVRMVKTEYDIDTYRQLIQRHDPTTEAGQSLGKGLKKLFFTTREQFVEQLEQQPLAHRSTRLHRLEKEYQEARDAANHKLAVRILGEAEKMMRPMEYEPLDPDADEQGAGDE